MKIKLPLLLVVSICLMSCSMNKAFLQPQKIPVTTKKVKIKSEKDTLVFNFGDNFQPTITNLKNTAIDLDFTIESVVFKSSNGNKLNGWFLKPKKVKPLITLIHFHGNAGALLSQYQAIAPIIKHGFQVFIFDYSGFGFSEGKATRDNVLTDGLSAVDFVLTRQEVKNTKIALYGQSLGGHLAAVVAEKRQNNIDALIIEAAFTSYKAIGNKKVPLLGSLLTNQKYSALESIKKYTKPVLVIHSTEDKIVPFVMGKNLFESANNPKEFFEIKGKHIYGILDYSEEIANKIKKLLVK